MTQSRSWLGSASGDHRQGGGKGEEKVSGREEKVSAGGKGEEKVSGPFSWGEEKVSGPFSWGGTPEKGPYSFSPPGDATILDAAGKGS